MTKVHSKVVADVAPLFLEWHHALNKKYSAQKLTLGSGVKVWWICERDHEWQATPNKRAYGQNCPYCAGNLASDENNLTVSHPSVFQHWDVNKNSEDATNYLPGSSHKVWWVCEKGHQEFTSIRLRARRKHQCLQCLKARKGDLARRAKRNDNLKITHPNLINEWDFDLNDRLPEFFTKGSNDKVFWRCEYAHSWQAVISSRALSNTGCPYCAGQLVSQENSLYAQFPELAQEWDVKKNKMSPQEVAPFSDKKAWWLCSRGHSWKAVIGSRSYGNGCPKCSNQTSKNEIRILAELKFLFTDILSRHKIANQEVDIYIPSLKMAIEYDGSYWHKNKFSRDIEKQTILEDHGVTVLRVREHPLEKFRAWDLLVPKESLLSKSNLNQIVTAIGETSKKTNNYLKSFNFKNEELYRIYLDYFPSPFPENSLAALKPQIAKNWHPTKNRPLSPLNFTQKSSYEAWWICDLGHEWQAKIYSRSNGTGCPTCVGKTRSKEQKNIKMNKLREMAKSRNGDLLTASFMKAKEKMEWRCEHGHTWWASSDNVQRGKWCPECSGRDPKGFVAKAHRYAASKNGKILTDEFTSKDPVEFQCAKGHRWKAKPTMVMTRMTWCKKCNQSVGTPHTIEDMQHIAQNRGGHCLSKTYVNAKTKLTWQCAEGHVFESTPDLIKNRNLWCKICKKN